MFEQIVSGSQGRPGVAYYTRSPWSFEDLVCRRDTGQIALYHRFLQGTYLKLLNRFISQGAFISQGTYFKLPNRFYITGDILEAA
jgi:hypothetical protein